MLPTFSPPSADLATHPLTWAVLFFALCLLRTAPLLVRLAGVSTAGLVMAVAAGWLPTLRYAEIAGVLTVLAQLLDVAFGSGAEVMAAATGTWLVQQGATGHGHSYAAAAPGGAVGRALGQSASPE